MKLLTVCSMCGTDLTQPGTISIDFPDVEWCFFTGQLEADGLFIVDPKLRRQLPDDHFAHLSCANCGDWLQEL